MPATTSVQPSSRREADSSHTSGHFPRSPDGSNWPSVMATSCEGGLRYRRLDQRALVQLNLLTGLHGTHYASRPLCVLFNMPREPALEGKLPPTPAPEPSTVTSECRPGTGCS